MPTFNFIFASSWVPPAKWILAIQPPTALTAYSLELEERAWAGDTAPLAHTTGTEWSLESTCYINEQRKTWGLTFHYCHSLVVIKTFRALVCSPIMWDNTHFRRWSASQLSSLPAQVNFSFLFWNYFTWGLENTPCHVSHGSNTDPD